MRQGEGVDQGALVDDLHRWPWDQQHTSASKKHSVDVSRCKIVVLLLRMDEELNPVYGVVLQSEVLFRTKRSNTKRPVLRPPPDHLLATGEDQCPTGSHQRLHLWPPDMAAAKISSILGQISYGEESKAFGLWVSYFGVKLTILTISEALLQGAAGSSRVKRPASHGRPAKGEDLQADQADLAGAQKFRIKVNVVKENTDKKKLKFKSGPTQEVFVFLCNVKTD
ncbi:hypothetical protein Anapl_06705 [Anas platyrhynchos]|uniref:Uncharacterized protein n=1 Tax=Anas platyrhynchos TaxID=8839 RepID=R0LM32_ANAPL|nr:hypothetical protein Anapl_06705 [Anas platyrhynchos]